MKDFLDNLPKAIGTALGTAHKKALDGVQWFDETLDKLDDAVAHAAAPSLSHRAAFLDELIQHGTSHYKLRGKVYKVVVTEHEPAP